MIFRDALNTPASAVEIYQPRAMGGRFIALCARKTASPTGALVARILCHFLGVQTNENLPNFRKLIKRNTDDIEYASKKQIGTQNAFSIE